MRNDYNRPMSNAKRYEMQKQFELANQNHNEKGEKITMKKWATVNKMIKTEINRAFENDEALQKYLNDNPHLELNQIYSRSASGYLSVTIYEKGYAETGRNNYGYRVPTRWLTDEEVEEYLKDPTA